MEKSEILRLLHKDEAAIESLLYTLELSPGWTWAANKICDLYEKTGDIESAIKVQQKTSRHSPLASSPYVYLADLQARIGKTDEAIENLNKALEINSSYFWAWKKLYALESKKNNHRKIIQKLENTIEASPENSTLLEAYAELSNNTEKSIGYIQKYLSLHPHNLDICIKLIQIYVSNGDFDGAKHYISTEYWENQRPAAIIANEAWVNYKQNNVKKAISIMEEVANKSPNYYDAWRYLTIWNCELNNKDAVENSAAHCVRIYPHDSNVLCFCAEKLQQVGSNSESISVYLKHAFELDPSDQYNALTYIDHLLEERKTQEAKSALKLLLIHHKNPYVYLRSIQASSQEKNDEDLLNYFNKSIIHSENNSVIYNMWHFIRESSLEEQAILLIEKAQKEGKKLDAHIGRCLGEHDISILGIKKFQKNIEKKPIRSAIDQRYIEAYLRFLDKNDRQMPNYLEQKLKEAIKQDTINWSLLGFIKYKAPNKEYEAANYMHGLENREDVRPWILYYSSMANRWCHQWEKGEQILNKAYLLPDDNFRNDILLWHITDRLLANDDVDCSPLEHLQHTQLESMSYYVLAITKALAISNKSNFVDSYSSITPLLRDAQHHFQKFNGNSVLQQLKKTLYKRLKNNLPPLSFFKKLLWLWRLSNHF